ncbi:MAG: nitroreductase family protein [Gammaproteobacteria bacterium]|nr:nitroreductase family protein [Gammaproteobacteria bacterium]
MWDFFATVRNRHSIRKYQSDMPVEKEKLHAIIETACSAPSAGDLQSYQIVVVSSNESRDALCAAMKTQNFISQAPVCLVFCSKDKKSEERYGEKGSLFALQDATIACAYAQLAVVAAGLGSTWIGEFDAVSIRKALRLEDDLTPVAILSLGYPAEIPEPTSRLPIDEVLIQR